MDRAAVKLQARQLVQSQRKPILLASLLFLALAVVVFVLSYLLIAPSQEDAMRYMELVLSRDYEAAGKLMARMEPATRDVLISDVLSYLLGVVFFGFVLLMLKAVRRQEVVCLMVMDGFGSFIKVLLLEILFRLLFSIGITLLIVPGIFILYFYRMARYLLLIHPEYGVLDCLRESRRRTAGHRWEFFLLDLSFLGWALLTMIPVLGLVIAVWLLPYWQASSLLYCEAINADFEPAPDDAGPQLP